MLLFVVCSLVVVRCLKCVACCMVFDVDDALRVAVGCWLRGVGGVVVVCRCGVAVRCSVFVD